MTPPAWQATRVMRAAILAVLAMTASCADRPEASAMDAKQAEAWRSRLVSERAGKDQELATSPTSVMAAVARFTPKTAGYLRIDGDDLALDDTQGPASLIAFEPADAEATRWTWHPLRHATGNAAVPAAPVALTQPVRVELTPRLGIEAQISGGGLVILGFDHQRKELLAFKQLDYFEPDPKWFVMATLARFDHPTTIELPTSRGLKKRFVRYGQLRFTVDGAAYTLTAFRPAGSSGKELFVPFRDATSGKQSYGAARFLDLEEPADPAARVALDFNEAYNPLCAYSNAYNCPMPPAENQLAVAVTAGERDFGGHAH
jgi:uncharacterized protein (DUF1684 family)